MKKYPIKSCFDCPYKTKYGKEIRCKKVKYRNGKPRLLHEKDVFTFETHNEVNMKALKKYLDWCLLEDF
jgi:hypothetical protein